MANLIDWIKNDPNPMKTLDIIKQKQDRLKKLSIENPLQLMKEMLTPDEIKDFNLQIAEAKSSKELSGGYDNKKYMKLSMLVPECVASYNPEYWSGNNAELAKRHPYFAI